MSGNGRHRQVAGREPAAARVERAHRRLDEASPVDRLHEVLDGAEPQPLEPLVDDRRDEDRRPAGRFLLAQLVAIAILCLVPEISSALPDLLN